MVIFNESNFEFSSLAGRLKYPGYSLTFIIKGTFDIALNKVAVIASDQLSLTGDELYEDDDEGNGSCRYESDFVYFKPRADLLLVGKCYSPAEKPILSCQVKFQVGGRKKSLAIFGDRHTQGLLNTKSKPEPFTTIEMRYENSYGGEYYKINPVGKGYKKNKQTSDNGSSSYPNIEHITQRAVVKTSNTTLAGFGPLGRSWSQRFAMMGSYKDSWLKDRWPWFPKDFDWGYFNAAPTDMQLEGYLRGDEKLYFENLHRVHPQYYSQLPGLRARCFINEYETEDKEQTIFREVPLNLDTLWVDMEAEKLTLVWRGAVDVESEEHEEIQDILVVSEVMNEPPRPIEFYKALFIKRLAEESGDNEENEDSIVEPLNIDPDDDAKVMEEELKKVEKNMRAALIDADIDPDNLPVTSPEQKEEEKKVLKDMGVEVGSEIISLTREVVIERIGLGEGFSGDDLSGLDLSGLNMSDVDFTETILTDISFQNANLSGANLSEAALSGVNLIGADMRNVNLKDADLSGANLSGVNLTGALLEDADFELANLDNATLDNVEAFNSCFSKASIKGASLKGGFFKSADFSNCVMDKASFHGCNLQDASFEGARGVHVDLSKTDLTEFRASCGCVLTDANFRYAIGHESIWEEATLNGSDFSFSHFEGADFSSTHMESVNLVAANMKYSRFIKANLKGARMNQINLFQGSLEKADLTDADLRGANCYEVEFLDSIVERTLFEAANLKMTKLSKFM